MVWVLALAAPCTVVTAQTWLPAIQYPPPRSFGAAVYDPVHERVVLFGGESSSEPLADLWERSRGCWLTQRGLSPVPGRWLHAMAYDVVRQSLVLFGGTDGRQPLGDTWEHDGNVWRRRLPATNPSPRTGHTMVYDTARRRVVMFGGENAKGLWSDTWEWDGIDWQRRSPAVVPGPRRGHAMVHVPGTGRSYMFGGGMPLPTDELWQWDGNNWSPVPALPGPSAREFCGAAFDIFRQRLVVFGGADSTSLPNDVWEFDGATWMRPQPSPAPGGMLAPIMVFDDATGRVVVFGRDASAAGAGVTWTWDGRTWARQDPPTTPSESLTRHAIEPAAIATDTVRQRVVALQNDRNLVLRHWEWNGTTWREVAVAVPGTRWGHALAYDQARQRVVLFGGWDGNRALAETWVFDGVRWSLASPPTSPPARFDHAMTYDPARGRVVMFGGATSPSNSLDDTWEWDGSTWTQASPGTRPPARHGHALAHDPVSGAAILFGGQPTQGSEALRDAWSWNGGTWSRLPDAWERRVHHAMTFDPVSRRMVVAGGARPQEYTLAFDGQQWTYPAVGGTGGRAMMAADPVRGRAMAVAAIVEPQTQDPKTRRTYHLGTTSIPFAAGGGCQQTALSLDVRFAPRIGVPLELSIWDRPPAQTPRPHAPVAWLLGQRTDQQLGPCRLAVNPIGALVAIGATNAHAFASLCLQVPADPTLLGARVYAQAAIADNASAIGITLSIGLELRIGG